MKKYAKKYALVIILIAFAITIILWPLATTQSISTTQEDPGTAQSGFTVSLPIIGGYDDIADILASGGYDSIGELIQESDDIPVNIKFIYQTYNDLLSDITTKLSNMETKLDEAELLLSEGEFDKTYLNLTSAEDLGEDIEALLEDMENANELIINILGSFAPADQTEKAVELRVKLSEDTDWLKRLRAAYEESVPQNIPTGLDDLEVPGQIYPGMPYTISGQITYDSEIPSIERAITLLWDGEPLDSAYSYRAQSTFEIEVTPDENTMLGEHRLTVIIEPQDQYSIASEIMTLTVTKDLPEIRIEDLSYKLLSRKVQVRGKLSSETNLDDATVVIELKGTSTRVSPSEGEFEVSLDLPLGLINLGQQEIKIRFEPSEAWQSQTEITAEIFVLDIFSLGFISTGFAAVGMIVYVARRGRPGKGGSWILETPPVPEPSKEFTNTPLREFEEEYLKGTRGQILKLYTETMERVENDTGVSIKPYMTLREFLKETTPKLNGTAGAFKELTRLAEAALYSPRLPGPDDTERAETMAMTVKEALKS